MRDSGKVISRKLKFLAKAKFILIIMAEGSFDISNMKRYFMYML